MKVVVEGTEKELKNFFSKGMRGKLKEKDTVGVEEVEAVSRKKKKGAYKWTREKIQPRVLSALRGTYKTYPMFQKAVVGYNPSRYQRKMIEKIMKEGKFRANITSTKKGMEQLKGATLVEKVNEMKEELKPRIIEHLGTENWKPRTTLIKEVNHLKWPHGAMLNAIEESIAELVEYKHVERFNMGRNVYFRRGE